MEIVIPILLMVLIVCTFGALIVFGSSLLGPKRKANPVKNSPYECGIPGQSAPHTQVSVQFFLTALLFILFDIEIIFLFPWAMSFSHSIESGYGLQILLAMGVFILLFIVGLIWEIKSRALEWNK